MTTLSAFMLVTLSMSWHSGGSWTSLPARWFARKRISLVFALFSLRHRTYLSCWLFCVKCEPVITQYKPQDCYLSMPAECLSVSWSVYPAAHLLLLLLLILLQISRFKWRHHNHCGGTLQSLPIKMLHNSWLDDGVLSVSRKRCQISVSQMTDGKDGT